MVSGHLQQKNGLWYAVLNLYRADGSRQSKWLSTKLKAKGNRKRAEEILWELRKQYTSQGKMNAAMPFAEYLESWLSLHKAKIAVATFHSYHQLIKKVVEYFAPQQLLISTVKPAHIETFYQVLYAQGLSSNSVLHYHALLHKALADAVRNDIISTNPMEKVSRPSKGQYTAKPYTPDEMRQLFAAIKGDSMEVLIKLTAYYGLRRSEALGLRWQAIDFDNGTISINHTVVQTKNLHGQKVIIGKDTLKNKSSNRTLPMTPEIRQMLLNHQGKCDRKGTKPVKYLFADASGNPLKPDYVTNHYVQLLKKHHLRPTRFHDLRHASASALVSNRVPLIEVQQWLGHSTIRITADLYSHLEYKTKEHSAAVLSNVLFNYEKE